MSISSAMKKQFRSIGHNLNPVVTISGNGLSAGVMAEIDRALEDHELIKVKVVVAERESRKTLVQTLIADCGAELIQEIGKVALIFREAKKPHPLKSNIR